MKHTRIVCTMGPACASDAVLERLIEAGMDVARLNFSHGTHDAHRDMCDRIRHLGEAAHRPVGILQDLCGPKIRLGTMPPNTVVKNGDPFVLAPGDAEGNASRATVSYDKLAEEVPVGSHVLIDDGLVEMVVESIADAELRCKVVTGGPMGSHKGVNFPGVSLSIPAVTPKDWDDLRFGLSIGVDFVALSFVRNAGDVLQVKAFIYEQGHDTPVLAKIEKFEALENLEEILHVADGAMVARGDLGVETAFTCVPLEQKRIIALCRRLGKPVITATQMLDSMMRNPRPTRAEVTDVANAVLDGTDAVMLSGETASGDHPVEAVQVMASIITSTEASHLSQESDPGEEHQGVGHALSRATCEIADVLKAKLIVACTTSGSTARWLAAFRPKVPILAVTHSERLVRRLALSRGVFPVVVEQPSTTEKLLEMAREAALESGLAQPGDLAVIQAGIPPGVRGSTNMIKLDVLGHTFHRGLPAGPGRQIRARTVLDPMCAEPGDILVAAQITEAIAAILPRLGGVIIQTATPEATALLAKTAVPGVLQIPDAVHLFADGRVVTLDAERGLVYEV